jgi:signal transduction histidine kinase
MELTNFITLATALTNFLLGVVVLGRGASHKLNQKFAFFAFITSAWAFSNFILTVYPGLLILETTYAVGALIMPFALSWFYQLLSKRRPITLILVFLLSILAATLSYLPGSLIKSLDLTLVTGSQITYGPGFLAYSAILVTSLLLFITELVIGVIRARAELRKQIFIVLLGVTGTISIVIFVIFILPLFDVNVLSPIDAQSTLLFVGFSAYAIIRHRFMDVKVVATQLVVSVLTIFLLGRIFFSASTSELVINSFIFILGVIIGLLLIRSVVREVERREEIERLNKQLSDFLRFGTHELRSPLGAIRGYTSMVLEGSFGKLTDGLQRTVRIIQTEIDRLLLLVETFLDANRARSGRLEVVLEPTDIASAINRVLDTQRAGAKLKKIDINLSIADNLPDVVADPRKVQIIFGNVISNAIKYTLKGSVTINVRADERCVTVSVIDTGIGIPKEVIPQLFTQFERGTDRAKRVATGSGIGLYLTKKLVDAMDAEISISSPGPEKGSTATLRFKCWKAVHPVRLPSK